jgi:hypothetical protein
MILSQETKPNQTKMKDTHTHTHTHKHPKPKTLGTVLENIWRNMYLYVVGGLNIDWFSNQANSMLWIYSGIHQKGTLNP